MHDILNKIVDHADITPNRPAIMGDFGMMTYAELGTQVRRTARWAETLPQNVGLLAPRGAQWIVWYLALAWAGRTIIPLPEFFSSAQLAHIVADAHVETIVCAAELEAMARDLCHTVAIPHLAELPSEKPSFESCFIIYTSGTSGRPKGVVLRGAQVAVSVRAMIDAAKAAVEDRVLSVLPQALLLEQVGGMLVPLAVGASIALCAHPNALPKAAEDYGPTTVILVPEMLAGWVRWLESVGRTAPPSLRFVAVGGAPVPPKLAEKAWSLGLPVHEGYGLSECCSVVALNRPGDRRAATVGKPIAGIEVYLLKGEIVVVGPTVMAGYLGGEPSFGIHRTGDAGHFDGDGNLVVDGRIDDVVVTATGRNIHPEWIESMMLSDARIGRCALVRGDSHPCAILVPSSDWLVNAEKPEIDRLVATLCADAPAYARPGTIIVMTEAQLRHHNLITANGRLRRKAIAAHVEEAVIDLVEETL